MLLEFAKILEQIKYEDLPTGVIKQAKNLITNFVGGALPGADADIVKAERALWDEFGGKEECSVLGQKGRVPAVAAAAINAAMGQVFLEEECHDPTASHPGVIVIPTALAIGQSLGSSGREVIAAVVAGFEGMGRIGRCLALPGFSDHGLRTAAIIGPFGSCIAAGKLMHFTAEQLRDALGIAGNYASGVMEFTNAGTPDICIQNCNSARSGVLAALEAKHGMIGAPTILDGPFGLGCAFNRVPCDWSLMTAPIHQYEIEETFVKTFPSCGHVLATAQAITEICKEHDLRPEDIRKGTISTRRDGFYYPGCNNQGPFAGTISAMTSHQFITASCIINHGIHIQDIKNYSDPAVYALAQRLELVVDDEISKLPGNGGRVSLELTNGEVITNYQERTYGLSDEGIRERLINNAPGYFSAGRARRLLELSDTLETLENIQVFADLMESDV